MSVQARSIAPSLITLPEWTSKTRAAPKTASDVAYELITTRDAFDALENDWNALFERAGRPTQVFQTFNWNWHWANTYLATSPGGIAGLELAIVTARRNGQLIAVWPLVSERQRGIKQVFWMGDPVSQYGDVVVDDVPDAIDVIAGGWQYFVAHSKADVVRLRRVRAEAAVAPLMPMIGAYAADRLVAPYLELSSAPDFAKYEERYSGHARRNRRRLLRRLQDRGDVVFERHHGGPRARELAIKALEMKAEWLKHRGLISHAISDQRMSRFFADAAEGGDRSTNCIVTALISNGETAALEVCFECKGRLAMHVIVYQLKFEKAGAGVILMENSLRDGYKDNIAVYDMLAPGDNYKLDWADATTDVFDWVKPLSLAGFAYARLYLGFVRPKIKAGLAAMPQSWRRIITRAAAH